MREALGRWFDRQQENSKGWLVVFSIFLALLLAANFYIHPVGGGHGSDHGGGHGDGHAQVVDTHASGHGEPAPAHGEDAGGHGFWDMPPAHFGYDMYPGFFALFGFLGAVCMVIFVKKIAQPVIEVPEDPDDV